MSDPQRETTDKLDVQFNEQGLVPAIVQDIETDQVLMLGWMNEAALRQTLATGKATFYSRSRKKIWVKGEESGHVQQVIEARVDCDQDVVLLRCRSHGPACHVGYHTCFYRSVVLTTAAHQEIHLKLTEKRVFDPAAVYKK